MSDGMDGLDWLSYTAVTPRASLQSDANNMTWFPWVARTCAYYISMLFSFRGKDVWELIGVVSFIISYLQSQCWPLESSPKLATKIFPYLTFFCGGTNIDLKHRFHGGRAVLDREFMGSTLKLNVSSQYFKACCLCFCLLFMSLFVVYVYVCCLF